MSGLLKVAVDRLCGFVLENARSGSAAPVAVQMLREHFANFSGNLPGLRPDEAAEPVEAVLRASDCVGYVPVEFVRANNACLQGRVDCAGNLRGVVRVTYADHRLKAVSLSDAVAKHGASLRQLAADLQHAMMAEPSHMPYLVRRWRAENVIDAVLVIAAGGLAGQERVAWETLSRLSLTRKAVIYGYAPQGNYNCWHAFI